MVDRAVLRGAGKAKTSCRSLSLLSRTPKSQRPLKESPPVSAGLSLLSGCKSASPLCIPDSDIGQVDSLPKPSVQNVATVAVHDCDAETCGASVVFSGSAKIFGSNVRVSCVDSLVTNEQRPQAS